MTSYQPLGSANSANLSFASFMLMSFIHRSAYSQTNIDNAAREVNMSILIHLMVRASQ